MPLQAGKLYRPTDIAADITKNTVYVVEQFNHRVSRWRNDPQNFGIEFTFTIDAGQISSITPTAPGQDYTMADVVIGPPDFSIPNAKQATAIAIIDIGEITGINVIEPGNGYVSAPTVTITGDGTGAMAFATTTGAWGNNGNDGTTGQGGTSTSPTDNFLYNPGGIVISPDLTRLYVTDTFNHRIRVIDTSDGTFTTSAGQSGTGDTDLYRPFGIAINPNNTFLVIADEFNRRVVRYVPGAMIGDAPTFSSILTEPTKKFVKPHGVSFDETQTEFVVSDTFRGLLSRYDDDGTTSFIGQIGKAGGDDDPDELYFPGSGHGAPVTPDLIFANTRKNSLKQLNASVITNFLTGVAGTNDGQLYWPESSLVFTNLFDYLLIPNTRNHRVEVFAQELLTFESNFGSP